MNKMDKLDELHYLLCCLDKWDENSYIYEYSQALMDIVKNVKQPMKYIKLGQPIDKELPDGKFLGPSALASYIKIGGATMNYKNTINDLTKWITRLYNIEK